MSQPDLGDPVALAAYRAELRSLHRGWRWIGLALTVAGVALMFARSGRFDGESIGLIVIGWIIFITIIVKRTRYHKARMAEPE